MGDFLGQPVATLSGAGNKTAALFTRLGIHNLWDLLLHLPMRYEDRTKITQIALAAPSQSYLISGRIEFVDVLTRGHKSIICQIKDDTGSLYLRFFHFSARQYQHLKPGATLLCYGEIRTGYHGLEMIHPDYRLIAQNEKLTTQPTLTPVYPLTQGLGQNSIRKLINQVLAMVNNNNSLLGELIPNDILELLQLPSLLTAINTLHHPDSNLLHEKLTGADSGYRRRLAFEELLAHYLSVKTVKMKTQKWQAPSIGINHEQTERFLNSLPFRLTAAQSRVIADIAADFLQANPMMRLVQGDVGSGKTIVAAYAALLVITSDFQAAIMTPTELLAEQHFRNFTQWFSNFPVSITLLTSQLKSQKRSDTLSAIADGKVNLVIGTHALFQEAVDFKHLALVIIDEQHRFGVHQRLALQAKGQREKTRPHQLVMTATPIPRTLAMLQYADLDISIIDELPPGRKAVSTSVIPNERRNEVIERINCWIEQKRQVYWVCTLIEESEILQREAAEITAARLAERLTNVKVGLLHGRMKTADRDAVMHAFKQGDIDLLVATTVIEVGVDVPNANLMIIENPERLGLSQLHQLRGRVGRGDAESFCLLLYQSPLSDNARQRLAILRDSQDGFVIAEKDLQLRGPGEVLGTRQTGQVNFKVADLVKNADLLDNIPAIADSLLAQSPAAAAQIINRWIGRNTDYFEV